MVTRTNIRERNRQAVRPLRTVRENKAEKVNQKWYMERANPIASSDDPSQRAPQTNVSTVSNIMDAILNQPVAEHSFYEMTAKEVKKHRIKLYALNKTGDYQYYTRYLDGRYLLVIRMK